MAKAVLDNPFLKLIIGDQSKIYCAVAQLIPSFFCNVDIYIKLDIRHGALHI